nr:PssD/Cps14F family polysaccharide biosynthesis glycosyltransferase [Fredinandcohnia onubensis]
MPQRKKICLISSSGGHFSQLKQITKVFDQNDLLIIVEKSNIEDKKLSDTIKCVYLMQQDRKKRNFLLTLMINFVLSFLFYIKFRPKVIISTGAGAVIPFCFIAKMFGSKIIFIESFAKTTSPTITGKIIYRIADQFYIQWEELKKYYPNALYKGQIY